MTSFSLNLDPKEQPFHPKVVLQNYRSAVLADIRDAQLDVLREVAPQIIDPEMRARIGDILWVRKRDFRMAQLAIEAYLASATRLEDPQSWPPCERRIKRAVQLAASLGRTGEYFSKTLAHVEAVLDKYNAEDPRFLSAEMMELLLTYRPRDASKYAALAEKAASRAEAERDWHRARTYWKLTARWRSLEKETDLERTARIREGETYVKEAEEAVDRTPPGYLEASMHLPKAIEALRRIRGSQERIDELHRRLLDYQGRSLTEMKSASAEFDASEHIEQVRAHIKGKTLEEALFTLARMGASPKVVDLRKRVQESARQFPLQHLMPVVIVNQDGKVIERKPSIYANDPDEVESAIRAEMFSQAMITQGIHAQATVEPAREQINSEHQVEVDDFLPIVSDNPFVPEGREYIYARGLHAGLAGDFLVAAHLLILQLEHSMRYLLFNRGVFTSGLDSQGIQEERNLNTLLYLPELKAILGEDITFDLQGLLVERYGSNLRNLLAHALLGQDAFFSFQMSYLWWLILRLCCLPLLAKNRGKGEELTSKPPDQPDSSIS
jgi:hypothetical protein